MKSLFPKQIVASTSALVLLAVPLTPATASRLLIPQSANSSLVIVDDRLQRPVEVIGGMPNIDGISSDGESTVVVTTHSTDASGKARISYLDVAQRLALWSLPLPDRSGHTAVSGNGAFAAVTQPDIMQVIIVDLHSRKIARRITFDSAPIAVLFSPASDAVYVTTSDGTGLHILSVLSAKYDKLINGLAVNGHIALNPSGTRLYADGSAPGTVLEFRVADMAPLRTITLGGELHGLAVSGDGSRLYAADFGDNRVVSLNLTSGMQTFTRLSPAPYHIYAVHDTSQILVTSADRGILWSMYSENLRVVAMYELGDIPNEIAEIEIGDP